VQARHSRAQRPRGGTRQIYVRISPLQTSLGKKLRYPWGNSGHVAAPLLNGALPRKSC